MNLLNIFFIITALFIEFCNSAKTYLYFPIRQLKESKLYDIYIGFFDKKIDLNSIYYKPFGPLEKLNKYCKWAKYSYAVADVSIYHFIYSFFSSIFIKTNVSRLPLIEKIKKIFRTQFSPFEKIFVVYSVRNGWNLILKSLNLPENSEVLVSGLTIPHMVKIVQFNNLIPKLIDINIDTLEPELSSAEQLVNKNTKVLIISNLFGTRVDFKKWRTFADDHNLVLVEDCAPNK